MGATPLAGSSADFGKLIADDHGDTGDRYEEGADQCRLDPNTTVPGEFCRVFFDKMQGGRAQLIAENSLRRRELEESLPKVRSREKLAELQGRLGEETRVAKGPDQGSRNPTIICSHGPGCISIENRCHRIRQRGPIQ
jgi:hypothetical protein